MLHIATKNQWWKYFKLQVTIATTPCHLSLNRQPTDNKYAGLKIELANTGAKFQSWNIKCLYYKLHFLEWPFKAGSKNELVSIEFSSKISNLQKENIKNK